MQGWTFLTQALLPETPSLMTLPAAEAVSAHYRKQDWKDGWGITNVWGTRKKGVCFEHLKLKVDLGLEEGGEFIGAKGGGPATWRSCD